MDYYKILGVEKTATSEDIKKKYKELAIKYHPDKNPSKDAIEKFKMINEAYTTLIDPYKRGRYDAMYERERERKHKYIEDIFEMSGMNMFNRLFRSDPFFTAISFPSLFQMSDPMFDLRIPSGSGYYSYSSSIFQKRDKDGKIETKHNIRINKNGQKDSYYREYYIDKDGKKHIVKEQGNPRLVENPFSNKSYKLLRNK